MVKQFLQCTTWGALMCGGLGRGKIASVYYVSNGVISNLMTFA